VLIIRRRRGESITIGDEVEIEILETSPTQVKLGIRAPKEVTVLRSEIRLTREINQVSPLSPAGQEKLARLAESVREPSPNSEEATPTSAPEVPPSQQKSNNP
jgi:carbon storage regulator